MEKRRSCGLATMKESSSSREIRAVIATVILSNGQRRLPVRKNSLRQNSAVFRMRKSEASITTVRHLYFSSSGTFACQIQFDRVPRLSLRCRSSGKVL
jgi:hypothetical protein